MYIYVYIYTDSESHWTINDQPNNILKQNRWFNFNLNFIAKSQKLPETLLVRQVDFVELALDHQILEIEDVEDVDVTHWDHWPPWKKNGPRKVVLEQIWVAHLKIMALEILGVLDFLWQHMQLQ